MRSTYVIFFAIAVLLVLTLFSRRLRETNPHLMRAALIVGLIVLIVLVLIALARWWN